MIEDANIVDANNDWTNGNQAEQKQPESCAYMARFITESESYI